MQIAKPRALYQEKFLRPYSVRLRQRYSGTLIIDNDNCCIIMLTDDMIRVEKRLKTQSL